jgi:plasmid stabilization system protein ParE
MKVVLLELAKEDLKEIRQYISKENPTAAKMVAKKIKDTLMLLSEQPYI